MKAGSRIVKFGVAFFCVFSLVLSAFGDEGMWLFNAAPKNSKSQTAVVTHYVAAFKSLNPPAQLHSLYTQYVAVLEQELADLKQGNFGGLIKLRDTQARPLVQVTCGGWRIGVHSWSRSTSKMRTALPPATASRPSSFFG